MTPSKRCDLCETPLGWEIDGVWLEFTAHTPAFCRTAAKQLIANLKGALAANVETCMHRVEKCRRDIDRWLEERGHTTLKQHTERMARAAELKMALAQQQALAPSAWDIHRLARDLGLIPPTEQCTCAGCGKVAILDSRGPRPWICSACEIKREAADAKGAIR